MEAVIGEELGIDGIALRMGSAIARVSPDAGAVGAMAGKAEFGGGFKDEAFVTARSFAQTTRRSATPARIWFGFAFSDNAGSRSSCSG